MTGQLPVPIDFSAIKAIQRKTWAAGDYSIPGSALVVVSENLCETVELHAGQKVLDVATGSGNTAIAAARRYCDVTGIDFTPSLLERARERAIVERLPITLLESDAEDLPFPPASFDIVLSTLGVMFTPNQEQAASELLRVCRSGGKIGLANWTPDGLFNQMGRVLSAYAPSPPAGLRPPASWGREDRVRELFGEKVTCLQATTRFFYHRYRSTQHALEVSCTFGPLAILFKTLEPETCKQLAHDIMALFERANQARDGTLMVPDTYLEVVAVRR